MTKLLTFYNHTFNTGQEIASELFDIVRQDTSLNGLYLCLPNYLYDGYLGRDTNNTITWYNMLGDGNFLYGTGMERINASSQFNQQPCIRFNDNGLTSLRYHRPVTVGTVILVYLVRQANSYIIYAPRNTAPPNPVYYDAFPSGAAGTLWGNEPLANGSIYNATSRINSKIVSPNTFVPLNSTRVLSVKNIANPSQTEEIFGYGGQIGAVGGGERISGNSFRGSLAAVITFESNIDDDLLREIETYLGRVYIQYDGIVQITAPKFKYLVGQSFSYDFSTILFDEWFEITDYSLANPIFDLSFTGSILSGTLSDVFNGDIEIIVTNSAGMVKLFRYSLEVSRPDPILNALPATNQLELILSTSKHFDNSYYGLELSVTNQVMSWEDARRIGNVPKFIADPDKPCQFSTNSSLNNEGAVSFLPTSVLKNTTPLAAKTFVWVYNQTTYGTRKMLDTFPDIYGNGVLWSISNINEVHGNTPVTQLVTKVQNTPVNTLNFKVPLNTPYIIVAVVADNNNLIFNGFEDMKGDLAFFAAWKIKLTNNQITDLVATLANRYYASSAPYIFNNQPEFKNQLNIAIDLRTKVVDLRNLPLSYDLLTPVYDAAIVNGILTLTGVRDETIPISIDVTNTIPLTSRLDFDLEIVARPNPLYLDIKNSFGSAIRSIYIAEADSIVSSSSNIITWEDYRLNDEYMNGNQVSLVTLPQLDDKYSVDFNIDGSSYLDWQTSVTGRCFCLVLVRKENTSGKSFLFGQDASVDFMPGDDGVLWTTGTSASILNEKTYINGIEVSSTYRFTPQVCNVIAINTSTAKTVDSIAKDRVFTDRSCKGYVSFVLILNRKLTASEALNLNKLCRNYYDPARFVLIINGENNIQDSSPSGKLLSSNASVSTAVKRFGTGSIAICTNSVSKYIDVPNEIDFAFLREDFTVSFWLNSSGPLLNTDIFSIYNQTELIVYLSEGKVFVGRNYTKELALLVGNVPLFNTFVQVTIVRDNLTMSLFINGQLIASVEDVYEYVDYNTLIKIGQSTNLTTPNLSIFLDELVVHRRSALKLPQVNPYS